MLDQIPEALAFVVAGIILMVLVVVAVTEGWERRRKARHEKNSAGDGAKPKWASEDEDS
jgi:uncharacterized protein (DUF2062 family)